MGVPPIISGTGKATDVKIGRYIDRVYLKKSPLKPSGTVAICVVRESFTYQVTHTLRASRGYLCDSTAFLFLLCYRFIAHEYFVCPHYYKDAIN